jgi:hypothetical protein
LDPLKFSCQSRIHCPPHLLVDIEDEASSIFLSATGKTLDTMTTDPRWCPCPCSKNCPLGRRRPGHRLARGPPPIGPLLATPWSSTGPCRPLRSLCNRDSWGVLTADRRHPPHSRSIGTAPPTSRAQTHVDDSQPPLQISPRQRPKTKKKLPSTSMSLRTAALGLARAATRRPFSTTMASSSSTTPMADTIREKVYLPPHHISLSLITTTSPSYPPSTPPKNA